MTETTLTDADGTVRFRGTLDPPGSGGFTGWTEDASNPANVDSNDGQLDLGTAALTAAAVNTAAVNVAATPGAVPSLIAGNTDPSVAGQSASLGSLYMRNTGQAWLKTGALDTDWTLFGTADPGVKVVRVPVAFNTANILTTGVVLYTPTTGDTLLLDQSYMTIPTTPFDGTGTAINLTYSNLAGAFGSNSIVGLQDVAAGDSHSSIPIISANGSSPLFAQTGQWILPDTTPLKLIVDDGAGGNPGMTAGAGEVVLLVIPA